MRVEPVFADSFADPFVLRLGDGTYCAYGTPGPGEARGAMRFPVLVSHDLARWRRVGSALAAPPALRACAFWAPEVAERGGAYHLYYSAGGDEGEEHRVRVAHATRPTGPFEDGGEVVDGEPFSIDASPFRDPRTGRRYLFFVKDFFDAPVGSGIVAGALTDDMARVVGPLRTICRARADWQIFARDREWYGRRWDAWHTVEGPCVVYRRGRYWLFYSGGLWKGASYGVGCAVADDVLGPYEEPSPEAGPSVLRSTATLRGPGHNCVVVGPDGTTDMIVFHAWDPAFTARRMFVAPLAWTPEGLRVAAPDFLAPERVP